jgi:4-hydroxyphenylacetate 3-monooxygenase
MDQMTALVERCMADYDENGWKDDTWVNPGSLTKMRAAE